MHALAGKLEMQSELADGNSGRKGHCRLEAEFRPPCEACSHSGQGHRVQPNTSAYRFCFRALTGAGSF